MSTGRNGGSHPGNSLPAFLNGTLGPVETSAVRAHLAVCPACRRELAEWESIASATGLLAAATPPAHVPAAVWKALGDERPAAQPDWTTWPDRSAWRLASLARQLLLAQIPLVRGAIWTASAVTMFAGCLVAVLLSNVVEAGVVLAMVAPLVAAIGVAFVYGPENDPGLEMSLATPTPPQLVLAARLTLVYGFDLALAVLAALVLAVQGGTGLVPLISLWLGPMLFLSALTLVLSLLWGSAVAIIAVMALWLLRLSVALDAGRSLDLGVFTELGETFWQRTPLLLALTALLLLVALIRAPRQERFSLQ
ncbi:MAG: zf-HC2 domain-containing protein [Chloroflexota bacterium]|nr:zf-HC2 domain-containing protein [Chloroflexota bacterium]